MVVIRGTNVTLRPFQERDIPHLLKWGLDPELAQWLEGDYPDTDDGYVEWLQNLKSDRHRKAFAMEWSDGRLIGDIELDHIAWRSGDAELRVRIGEGDFRGRGYGTEAVGLMVGHGFQNLNLRRIYLRVFQFNRRAIASYRKVGFKKEGVLERTTPAGMRVRIVLMRLLRHEFLSGALDSPQGIYVDM